MDFNGFPIIVNSDLSEDQIIFVNFKTRPVVVSPGESLTIEQQLERGIDWEGTAKASAVMYNVGKIDAKA